MRNYLGTISETWPNRQTALYWSVRQALGIIQKRDFGKQVFEVDNVIQVENDEQFIERMTKGNLSSAQLHRAIMNADKAIKSYGPSGDAAHIDLMTDILHWIAARKLGDPKLILMTVLTHYEAEK